jgi:hypothetical protein
MTTPLFMRDVSITFKLLPAGPGRVEHNCDVHTAEVVTTPGDVVSYQTLCPSGSFSNRGKSSYALHLVAAQDWSAAGLARFLWDNDGLTAEVQYQAHGAAAVPPTASQPGMAGVVTLVAPTYGGEADTYAELEVELPFTSKPTIATTAFPTLAESGEAVETDQLELPADESAA